MKGDIHLNQEHPALLDNQLIEERKAMCYG